MKAIFYVKKEKPYLFNQNVYEFYESKYITSNLKQHKDYNYKLNGKIVAKCDYEVEEITNCGTSFMIMKYDDLQESYRYTNKIARDSCLNYTDLRRYLGTSNGYAIHIKNLNIFDKPKELEDYSRRLPNGDFQVLGNSPRNMMKCCEIKYIIEDYILISITPEEACNILNKKQDILVRRNVLKEMLKNE